MKASVDTIDETITILEDCTLDELTEFMNNKYRNYVISAAVLESCEVETEVEQGEKFFSKGIRKSADN